MKLVLAATYGALGAVAWALWARAVAMQSPTLAALCDLAILLLGGVTTNYVARGRIAEFVAFALAAASGTWIVVYWSA